MAFRHYVTAAAIGLFAGGCSYVVKHDPNDELHVEEHFGHSDLKEVSGKLAESLLKSPQVVGRKEAPIVAVLNVANRTEEHIDTKAIRDQFETALLGTGKLRFVNAAQREAIQKEVSYQQGGAVSPESRASLGQQIGPALIVTGALTSIEKKEGKGFRLTKANTVYYLLTLEMTDLKTGELLWKDKAEIVKTGREPILGW